MKIKKPRYQPTYTDHFLCRLLYFLLPIHLSVCEINAEEPMINHIMEACIRQMSDAAIRLFIKVQQAVGDFFVAAIKKTKI